jgi:hypothetical protein
MRASSLNDFGKVALTKIERRGYARMLLPRNGSFGQLLLFMVNIGYFFCRLFASNTKTDRKAIPT